MKAHLFVNHHIRVRVISILLIISFVFIMSYILLFQQLKQEHQAEIDKKEHFTDMAATSVDDFLISHKVVLQRLASLDSVKQERRTEITQTLQDIALAQSKATLFWVANEKGTVVGKYPDTKADQNILDRDYFKEAMKGKTTVSGPYKGRITGKEVIIITVPYYRDNKVVGLVGMSVPLSELQNILDNVMEDQPGYAALVNYEDGQVLSHPELEQYRKTYSFEDSPLYQEIRVKKLTNGYFENDQEQNVHSFITLKEAPWVVILVQPLEEFNFAINQQRERNFTILILLILFLVIITHYLLILRDMENAEKNKQTEKLALVGELAAGIAHEIRNPLTSIKGFAQLIYEKRGQDLPPFYYETILEELDRIDLIVGEMVVLAKPAPETKRKVDLDKVLQDSVNLMSYQANLKEVQLVLNVEPGTLYIEGVVGQLKQVFINLIKNAIEAIENKGTVTIQARRQGEEVIITVEDTGPGMDKDVIKKLGTPFFSTKEKGTGLGLTITYRIIQNHKGKISVQSKKG